jgi:hypothetical protein
MRGLIVRKDHDERPGGMGWDGMVIVGSDGGIIG